MQLVTLAHKDKSRLNFHCEYLDQARVAQLTLFSFLSRAAGSCAAVPNQQHQQPPSDLALTSNEAPTQPKIHFPTRSFGAGRVRSFNPQWYRIYPWLEYSVERDAAFCYPCRMFRMGSSRSEDAFTVTGFRNWKHAKGQRGTIYRHNQCDTHKQAMLSWQEFIINSQHRTTIEERG